MIKHSFSFQKDIISLALRVLIYFTFLRGCDTTTSFSDIDLSTQTLDPTTTGFMMTGNAASNSFGRSVSAADINKDGYSDIIVGADQKNEVYVIYGGPKSSMPNIDLSTTTLDPMTTGFMVIGNTAPDGSSDGLGFSVSTAGDINQDGYDDIIIGGVMKNFRQGVVYVIYGGPKSSMTNIDLRATSLDPLTTGFMIRGNAANDWFGYSVSTAGDINKDGYDDIIVGSLFQNSDRGAAYVVYGGPKSSMLNIDLSTTMLNPSTTGFMITGNAVDDRFGFSVSTAGDINKDGYDDIIVGALLQNSNRGAAYVIYGGEKSVMLNIDLGITTLDPLTTGFMIAGGVGDRLGSSVRTARDINQDGYDDIIIGAYGKNSYTGAVYVVYGGEKPSMPNIDLSTTTLDPMTTGFMIIGNAAGDYLGGSVSTAGDINEDGYDDIIVGAYEKSISKGAVYVIYGGPKSSRSNTDLSTTTLDPLTTGFMITGNSPGDYFGHSVSTAGDINNDGHHNIIIGASKKNSNRGAAYVIYGELPFINQILMTDIACPTCWNCPMNCKQCSSASVCTECKNPYLLHQSKCLDSCPVGTFTSTNKCKNCPSYCSSCTSLELCQTCNQGYLLSNSLCILSSPLSPSPSLSQKAQEKATQAVSSGAQGVGSVVCVGSATFPLTRLVSKTVQNTRYLNLTVTNELAEIYQTWDTDMISWEVPNVLSSNERFKTTPILFARYEIGSPFLANFWPTLLNIGIGFTAFIVCIMVRKSFERAKYKGWALWLMQKLVAASFNFALVQAYACLDDILFYLVLDIKTNPFNSFFSWASVVCAVIFLAFGCLLVFFNFWTVKKYQNIKKQNAKDLEAFNERNKYWELFYADFNDNDVWSQSFFAILVIRSSLSSLFITVLYDYPLMQTPFLIALDGAIILFLFSKTPFKTLHGKLAQYYFETITLLVHICTFILSVQDTFEKPSETLRNVVCTGMLYLNTTLIGGGLGFMFIEIYETIRYQTQAQKCKDSKITPHETQETQNLTQKQAESIEAVMNHNGNTFMSGLNSESSQILETNFNVDHSILSNMNPSESINQQRNHSTMPRIVRLRPRSLIHQQQRNISPISNHARSPKQFENA